MFRFERARSFALGLGVFVGFLGVFDGRRAVGLAVSVGPFTLYVGRYRMLA